MEFKLNAVKLLESNNFNIRKTSIELNVDRKCIRSWLKQKVSLITCKNKRFKKKIGSGRRCFYPSIEKKLSIFINERRVNKRALSTKRLVEKAKWFSRPSFPNFVGSRSWVTRFLKRNNFCFR